MRKKNIINFVLTIFLGIIFLFLWLKLIDLQEFRYFLNNFKLKTALYFSIFYILAYFLRSIRWKIILNPICRISWLQSYSIFMVGMVINFLIPVRAGEIAKSVILKNKFKIPISLSLPTILIDKIADLFPILLILVLIPMISINMNSYLYTIIIILFLFFLLFIMFLFFATNHKEKAIKILNFLIRYLPEKIKITIDQFILRFVDGMTIMKGRFKDVIIIGIITLMAILSEAVYIFMLFSSFGISVSFFKILFGYTLMNLTYILPTPPAQIGSNQIMWVLIFSIGLNINENLTSVAVTFSHILTSLLIFIISFLAIFYLRIKFTDIIKFKQNNIK